MNYFFSFFLADGLFKDHKPALFRLLNYFIFLRMKRDDIIKQKLFEAYKLSEFYLNLIVDDSYNTNNFKKGNQEETPFQLSKSFSNKLYQIINRYDALLEQNEFEQNFQ